MKIRKSIIVLLVGTFVIMGIALLISFIDSVPPRSATYGSMHMCKRRVLRYAKEHGNLPLSLSETRPIEGFDSSIKDAWGVVIDYSVDTNGLVTFRSLGKDHAQGGIGDDADMIGIFPSKKIDGSWSDEFVGWSQDPFYTLKQKKPN